MKLPKGEFEISFWCESCWFKTSMQYYYQLKNLRENSIRPITMVFRSTYMWTAENYNWTFLHRWSNDAYFCFPFLLFMPVVLLSISKYRRINGIEYITSWMSFQSIAGILSFQIWKLKAQADWWSDFQLLRQGLHVLVQNYVCTVLIQAV